MFNRTRSPAGSVNGFAGFGPLVQLSSPATRPARYGLADSPINRTNGDGQSIVASATDSWRIEDAGHRNLRTHRLAHSAPASPATQSDVEDFSSQSPESNGLDRFLYRAHYALGNLANQVLAREYQLNLPNEAEIAARIDAVRRLLSA